MPRTLETIDPPALSFTREPSDSSLATALVSRYYAELDARFAGGFTPDDTVATEPDELAGGRGVLLVARLSGTAVGCGAFRRVDNHLGEIKRMWIDPVARGRGLGRALLVALEDEARTLGCTLVRLDTNESLQEALALYRALDYREIAPYNENRYATHWFEKRL